MLKVVLKSNSFYFSYQTYLNSANLLISMHEKELEILKESFKDIKKEEEIIKELEKYSKKFEKNLKKYINLRTQGKIKEAKKLKEELKKELNGFLHLYVKLKALREKEGKELSAASSIFLSSYERLFGVLRNL